MYKRVREAMGEYLDEILFLGVTEDEIHSFVRSLKNPYGIVTCGDRRTDFRLPFIHETWRVKWGGRTHIDMGCKCYHLMLDRYSAPAFINFIKDYRKNKKCT